MNEEEFIQSVDCRFPYFDEAEWKCITDQGISISANCAFMVLQEVCRPPIGCKVSAEQLKLIAGYWSEHFQHPLANRLYSVALNLIDQQDLSVEAVLALFMEIRNYPNQYNALSIAYFACNDTDGRIEDPYNEIIRSWQSA